MIPVGLTTISAARRSRSSAFLSVLLSQYEMALKHSSFMLKSKALGELMECSRLGAGGVWPVWPFWPVWLSRKRVESAGEDDDEGRMYLAVPFAEGWAVAVAWPGCKLSNWSGFMVGFSRSFWLGWLGKMPLRGDGVRAEDMGGGGWMVNKLSWSMGRLDADDSR